MTLLVLMMPQLCLRTKALFTFITNTNGLELANPFFNSSRTAVHCLHVFCSETVQQIAVAKLIR
jgi:hypothetical protein